MTAPALASPADASALAMIHATSFQPGWDSAAIAELLASPGCFAVWLPARAFILVRTVLDEAEIITLATTPAHRRHGLARTLLEAAALCCAARGAMTLHLEVAAGNDAACALYSAMGFRQIGQRPRYYADGGDARMLCLSLSAAQGVRFPE
jgi:[ribosomal protein S18]-alanine N-acetyltransferase